MDLHDPVARARDAETLREHPAFRRVLDDLEREQVSAWRDADTTEEREGAWYRLHAIAAVRSTIDRVIDAGKIEQRRNRAQ